MECWSHVSSCIHSHALSGLLLDQEKSGPVLEKPNPDIVDLDSDGEGHCSDAETYQSEIDLSPEGPAMGDDFLEPAGVHSQQNEHHNGNEDLWVISDDEEHEAVPVPAPAAVNPPGPPVPVPPNPPVPLQERQRAPSQPVVRGPRHARGPMGGSSSMWNLSTVWVGPVSFVERKDQSVTWNDVFFVSFCGVA